LCACGDLQVFDVAPGISGVSTSTGTSLKPSIQAHGFCTPSAQPKLRRLALGLFVEGGRGAIAG